MSTGHGLHKLTGGIAKREREAWERLPSESCGLRSCDKPAAALIQRWNGSFGYICEGHIAPAKAHGYVVTRKPSDA
jgi:hypothetical protein